MNRTLKFRAWNKAEMFGPFDLQKDDPDTFMIGEGIQLMQSTGLLDKALHELYEGDIIDIEGYLIGNIYEDKNIHQEKTNLIVQGFGDKNWGTTYKEAMERGCTDTK